MLLRPHPQESDKSLLSSTSQIRVQVEQTRLDILRMIRRRWVSIRQEGGFDNVNTWFTAELSVMVWAYPELYKSNLLLT